MRMRGAVWGICFSLLAGNLFAADGDFIVNGNVGVGTTSPIRKMHVASGSGSAELILEGTGGQSDWRKWNFYVSGASGDRQNLHLRILNDAGTGTILNSMSWLNNGNVGIGTTSPERALSIEREVLIRGNNASGTEYADWPYPSLAIRRSDDYVLNGITMMSFGYRSDPIYVTDDSVANFRIYDPSQSPNAATSSSTTQLRIASPGPLIFQANGGNVGIGKTAPTYLLEMESSGGGYYNQSTHSWTNGSSGRWKSGLKSINGALDTVLKLNGVSFKWKKRTDLYATRANGAREYVSSSWADDPYGREDIGLIGEEVRKVLPQVVDVDPKDANFVNGVAYSKIVPLLIEAMKEQQKQIEALKSKVDELMKRN